MHDYASVLALCISLYKRFEVWYFRIRNVEEDDDKGSLRSEEFPQKRTPHITTSSTRKKRVVVVGDSTLRGAEGPTCEPDQTHREVCCLPGARVKDVTRKLTCPVSHYGPVTTILY